MPLDIFFFQISDFSKKSFDIRFPDMNDVSCMISTSFLLQEEIIATILQAPPFSLSPAQASEYISPACPLSACTLCRRSLAHELFIREHSLCSLYLFIQSCFFFGKSFRSCSKSTRSSSGRYTTASGTTTDTALSAILLYLHGS